MDQCPRDNGVVQAIDVRAQLARMLGCDLFRHAPRLSHFLTFTVEQTLLGQQERLKEYLIGVEVFGRPETFDPRLDSIVRVEARRLRYKLDRYYSTLGQDDEVRIMHRRGSYTPQFIQRRTATDSDARRVLVAVANQEEAASLTSELNELQFDTVGTVASLPEAVDRLVAESPDHLVLDMALVDGAAGRSLAEIVGATATSVVCVTNGLDDKVLAHLVGLGATGYLLRPHRPGELWASLELGWRKTHQESTAYMPAPRPAATSWLSEPRVNAIHEYQ